MSINWEDNAELCEQLGKLFERWKPLVNNGTKVLMWDYKEKESIASNRIAHVCSLQHTSVNELC